MQGPGGWAGYSSATPLAAQAWRGSKPVRMYGERCRQCTCRGWGAFAVRMTQGFAFHGRYSMFYHAQYVSGVLLLEEWQFSGTILMTNE